MYLDRIWVRINRRYPVAWELPQLFLLALAFWYPSVHYAVMPARIPTHFGASGLPDAWGTKNWGGMLVPQMIMSIIYIFITGLLLWIASVDDPKQLMASKHSKQELERMDPERAEALRRVSIQGMFAIKVSMVLTFTYIGYASTNVALGLTAGLGWLMWIFIFSIPIAGIYMVVRIILLNTRK